MSEEEFHCAETNYRGLSPKKDSFRKSQTNENRRLW